MKNLTPSYRGVCWWTILALITVITLLRFAWLDLSPPGFYIDEAVVGLNGICVAQTGHDSNGVVHPFFSECAGGGVCSPTHTYISALWVLLFGSSIVALRALAALVMSLAFIGLFFFARVFMGNRGAVYVALAACLSPWMFQFARMAVDDPSLMLMGLTWGMYFFVRSTKRFDGVLSAFFFSLALYAYPPGRALIPLIFILLIFLRRKLNQVDLGFTLAFAVSALLFCSPLIWMTLTGGLSARYNLVGIFSPAYMNHIGAHSYFDLVPIFLNNVAAHLTSKYLFLTGDGNLRHSTQFVGELSWLDTLALVAGAIYFVVILIRRKQVKSDGFLLFTLAAFCAGMVPASLTWEGVPHSLRSLGCWPFVSLFTGYVIWKLECWQKSTIVVFTICALAFSISFGRFYVTRYPMISALWFDKPVVDFAKRAQVSGDWLSFARMMMSQNYDARAVRYYLVEYDHKTCDESQIYFNKLMGLPTPH